MVISFLYLPLVVYSRCSRHRRKECERSKYESQLLKDRYLCIACTVSYFGLDDTIDRQEGCLVVKVKLGVDRWSSKDERVK